MLYPSVKIGVMKDIHINKELHLIAIPLRFIVAGELDRYDYFEGRFWSR